MQLRIAVLGSLLSMLIAGSAAAASTRCYVFHNETSHEIRLDFAASVATAKTIPSKTLASHNKPWNFCISEGASVVIAVSVAGGGTNSWNGTLQMSTGSTGHPAGDYYIR
jgi:hypothetical protein